MKARPFHEHYRDLLSRAVDAVEQRNERTGENVLVIPGGQSFTLQLKDNILRPPGSGASTPPAPRLRSPGS
jgi:hypothetical protein